MNDWDQQKYLKFPDVATMEQCCNQLGLPPGAYPGQANAREHGTLSVIPIQAPWQTLPVMDTSTKPPTVMTAGVRETGVWALFRYRIGASPLSIAPAVTYLATPANPSSVYF